MDLIPNKHKIIELTFEQARNLVENYVKGVRCCKDCVFFYTFTQCPSRCSAEEWRLDDDNEDDMFKYVREICSKISD